MIVRRARSGLGLVEAMLALTLLSLALVPLLTVMSGSRGELKDSETFMGLLEQVLEQCGKDEGDAGRWQAAAGGNLLVLEVTPTDVYAGTAPRTGAER